MRALSVVIVAVVSGVGVSAAHAGDFGGFSRAETTYLDGDRICQPLEAEAAGRGLAPRCDKADAAAIRRAAFEKPAAETGTRARFAAAARGTTLRVTGTGKAEVARWKTTDPIERVVAVYASRNGRIVVVEYETRFGGRVSRNLVGFRTAGVADAPAAGGAGHGGAAGNGDAATSDADADTGEPASPELEAALKKARAHARRYRHKQAIAAWNAILAIDPAHSEALHGLARSLAARKQEDAALDALERLAASGRGDAIEYQVDARFDKVFARYRGDARFRKAVGLDAAKRPLFDRLVGFGGHWEQAVTPCERAGMDLRLNREKRTFRLQIKNKCQGAVETLPLGGKWSYREPGTLRLALPNPDSPDEAIECRVATCSDTDEDCITCVVDQDLTFVMREVRR